jgi:glycosyltransferase involved in cell wall biosynthesis
MVEDRTPERQVPVCIDGRLAAAEATGVASYGRALRDALAATGPAPLVLDDDQHGRFGEPVSAAGMIRRGLAGRLRGRISLQRDGERLHAPDVFRLAQSRFASMGKLLTLDCPGPAGIMHWTYPIPARINGWVNLYTVHDVIPLVAPDAAAVAPASLKRRILAVAAVADRLLTVSATARAQILSVLSLPSALVVDCGTAMTALEPGDGRLPADLRPDGYYLYCGLAEPRKNLPRLIAAWRASGTPYPLVLTGPDHQSIAPEPGLVILPYQPRRVLVDLMRQARALLFPSLHEGFGLPVAEAMALGTPVLTANGGALAEVADGAALMVDPLDEGAIARGIALLDREDTLRRDLAARGRVRAQAFTIERFGARVRRLHDEFASDSRFDV